MILVYDGSFESYLSLIYEVYYKKLSVEAILREFPHAMMFEEYHEVIYNEANALKVLEALKKKFSKQNFETILNIFMCDNADFELDLLHYIIEGFKSQRELQNINNTHIFAIHNLQKELFRNYHKMSGFLRFVELEDGSLYAKLQSKFNLVYLLGTFFAKRLNNQNYIIHDIERKLAFIHTPEFKGIKSVADFEAPTISKTEEKFSELWQTFFDSVAIQSRKNPKLQRQLVPLIYRTYMSEFVESV
jgi:probable DNA metabolism protein